MNNEVGTGTMIPSSHDMAADSRSPDRMRSQIDQLLAARPTPVRFPAELERGYNDTRERGRILALRAFLLAVCGIDLLCIGIDAVTMPDAIVTSIAVRALGITPVFLAAAWLVRHSRAVVTHTAAISLAMLTLVLGNVHLGQIAGGVHADRYLVGVMFANFALTVAANIPYRHTLFYLGGSQVTFAALVLMRGETSWLAAFADNVELLTCYPLSTLAGLNVRYRFEVMQRRHFLMMQQQKLHATELAKQRELNELTLSNMVQGLVLVDKDHRIQIMNARAVELLNLPAEIVSQRPSVATMIRIQIERGDFGPNQELLPPEVRETIRNGAPAAEVPYFEMRRADGTILGVRTVQLPDGGYVRAFTDITQRKQHEQQLIEARDAAEAASRARSEFLALMSHEIRTPMNAVMGLIDSLAETRLDAEQRAMLTAAGSASRNLLQILNDILDFSKLQAGRLQLEAIPFAPAAVIDEVVSILKGPAKARGNELAALDIDLPAALTGDPGRLRQVLLNLASNAVKFTENGRISLSARQVGERDGAVVAEFAVADTGIGIPADRIDRLFQEFVQADSSISRRFGGTGLGLAICRRIVRQMNGDIRVASQEGKGSVFTVQVCLPKADPHDIKDAGGSVDADGLRHSLRDLGRPLRLLLAEDNAMNQFVFGRIVQGLDIAVTTADNGRLAVEAAQAGSFDAVFMDLRMPEMDGLAATRALRALGGRFATLPIVALTANAFADDVQACREAGMSAFLAKPIERLKLFEVLDRLARSAVKVLPEASAAPLAPETPMPLAAAEEKAQPLLDPAVLAELADAIGEDGAEEAMRLFLADNRARIARLRHTDALADRTMVDVEAHSIKGAARALGFMRLSALAAALERQAATIMPADYAEAVEEIARAFTDTEQAMAATAA